MRKRKSNQDVSKVMYVRKFILKLFLSRVGPILLLRKNDSGWVGWLVIKVLITGNILSTLRQCRRLAWSSGANAPLNFEKSQIAPLDFSSTLHLELHLVQHQVFALLISKSLRRRYSGVSTSLQT